MIQSAAPAKPATMTRGLTLLFAIAGGAAVGNLYWAQPLLGLLAESFDISPGSAGIVVTVTQVGYALGVFFLVPLGDIVNRRRIIPLLMFAAAVFLTATALAPTFSILLASIALIGVTTVAGQFLTPLAGDLASDDDRGRVLGTVASGLVLGLLISRAISGIVADLFGWRVIFFAAAALMLLLTVVMARRLPTLEPREHVAYAHLIASVIKTVGDRTVITVILLGASMMCVFTTFWTGLTFLLGSAPFSFSAAQIGLVSLVGVLGAVAGQQVGRLHDRGLSIPALGVGLAVALAGLVLSGLGSRSLWVVLVAVAVFSVGVQVVQILSQTRMLSINSGARSRLNTVFIVGNFIGGAVGSACAAAFWQAGGWTAVMLFAATVVGFALTVWAVQRRRTLET